MQIKIKHYIGHGEILEWHVKCDQGSKLEQKCKKKRKKKPIVEAGKNAADVGSKCGVCKIKGKQNYIEALYSN